MMTLSSGTGTCAQPEQTRTIDARYGGSHATGLGVLVGVVDSGWDRSLDDVRVVPGIGLVDPLDELGLHKSNDDIDRNGHGTVCTAIILDVAADATVVPIRVFGSRLETSPDVLVAAIEQAIEQKLRLINLSLGTLRADAVRSLYSSCERARRAGVIVVAAARVGLDPWSYPAVFDPVIGVGPAALEGEFDVQFSPGAAVECGVRSSAKLCRGLGGRQVLVSGTSFAAPVVTALISRWLEEWPQLELGEIRERMNLAGRSP